MATVNFIPEHTQNASAMRGVIGYCQKEKKTVDEKSGRCLVSGINCNGENAYEEFMTTKHVYEKANGVFFYHYDQAFSPDEKVTPEEVHQIGLEFAKQAWPGHEVMVATHIDEPQLHSHFVINSVGYETGNKLRQDVYTLKYLRKISDEICIKHGLSVLKPYEGGGKKISTREYRAAMKGDSWKFRLINEVERAMKLSGSKKEFIAEMNKRGYGVRWTEERQNITYTCPDGWKCRDKKLHEDKFLKVRMEYEFKIRYELKGKLGNGNEGEEYGTVDTDGRRTISADIVRSEEGTERCGISNTEGSNRIPARVVSGDTKVGYESRDIKNVADNGTESAGREQEYHEQPDINECDYRSKDGEFIATGWERERQVYFEILKNSGYRGNEAEQSDEQFRETSVEVPRDIGRSGNLIVDVGVGTLTAVASLMDNDQDDDLEEKKKKLDAKDAGSNVGFALGSAIGLATALIAKSKKQDEDITEAPTEETDEVEEINNEPYEESEDLDEDEGFKLEM